MTVWKQPSCSRRRASEPSKMMSRDIRFWNAASNQPPLHCPVTLPKASSNTEAPDMLHPLSLLENPCVRSKGRPSTRDQQEKSSIGEPTRGSYEHLERIVHRLLCLERLWTNRTPFASSVRHRLNPLIVLSAMHYRETRVLKDKPTKARVRVLVFAFSATATGTSQFAIEGGRREPKSRGYDCTSASEGKRLGDCSSRWVVAELRRD